MPSPKGLGFHHYARPALKRWAIIFRPTKWDWRAGRVSAQRDWRAGKVRAIGTGALVRRMLSQA